MFGNYNPPKEFIPSDPRFGSGPSLVALSSVENLLKTGTRLLGTSHRRPPIKNLVKSIQEGLRTYFQLEKESLVLIGNGGATFLFDAIGLGLVQERSLHFVNGEFSKKWFSAHQKIPWIYSQAEFFSFGEGVRFGNTEGFDTICCTLNETSTGAKLKDLPKLNDQTILCMDATSGGGQINFKHSLVDTFFFSPQKVFGSEGGMFIVVLSEKAQDRIRQVTSSSLRYIPDIMNWNTHIDNALKSQTYTTPSISTLFFLDEQIRKMNKVGLSFVIEEGKRRAELIYGWAMEKPYCTPFIKEEEYRSTTVATIDIDESIDILDLLKRLHELDIVYGIESYRKLGRNQVRISLFYNIQYEDLEKLTKLLSHAIETNSINDR